MPELPEVETTRRGIAPYVEDNPIEKITIRQPALRWPITDGLEIILGGRCFDSVKRRGKYLLLTNSEGTLLIHLGMSGSLRVVTQDRPLLKHDHVDFIFADQTILRFNDPRRFGAILWTAMPIETHFLIKSLGPEPLSNDFSGKWLHSMARGRNTPVKSFIMDSRTVVGVGNIYANEALFLAGILPNRKAGNISLKRYSKLAECIQEVLEKAIKQGGTTLRNYVNESGKPGYFKQELLVYGRSGQSCRNCAQTLTEIRINNRSTVYCRQCQQ